MNMPWQASVTTGRELDRQLAVLTGEAAQLRVKQEQPEQGAPVPVWREVPSRRTDRQRDYYRLPLLKEPVWIWSVPVYFHIGGIAGGSALLAAFLHGRRRLKRLAFRCRALTFLGTTIGPALLTWDLGRISRFIYMLRVFRPSSPMSVGSWALAGTGMLSTLNLLLGRRRSGGAVGAGTAAGGLIVAGYTGVLLGNTANPLWRQRRVALPLLFTASAMASTAAALELLPLKRREERVVQRFGRVGKLAEAACMFAMERESSRAPEASRGLREGMGGVLWKGAKSMLMAGIALEVIPVRSTFKRRLGATLTTVGGLCLRFALLESGKHAAREPRALLEAQRRLR